MGSAPIGAFPSPSTEPKRVKAPSPALRVVAVFLRYLVLAFWVVPPGLKPYVQCVLERRRTLQLPEYLNSRPSPSPPRFSLAGASGLQRGYRVRQVADSQMTKVGLDQGGKTVDPKVR